MPDINLKNNKPHGKDLTQWSIQTISSGTVWLSISFCTCVQQQASITTTSITTSLTTTVRIPDLADVSFQCFVFSWWSQWGLFMGSLFCLCVDVLVGGSICPSLTSAALALWSCSLCFSSLFSVLVWGLPSMFFRHFRRSGRWWVAWVATTNACAEQVTHTTSTSSSVGNPNFFCTSLCIGCFCCCKVWAATLKKPSSHMQNSLLAPTLDPPSSSSFGIRKMSKRLDQRKQWKPSEWSGHHMASTKHGLLLEGSCWAE